MEAYFKCKVWVYVLEKAKCIMYIYSTIDWVKIYQMLFVAHRCLSMNFACALDKFNLARLGYDTIYYAMRNKRSLALTLKLTQFTWKHEHKQIKKQTNTPSHTSTHACMYCIQIHHYKPLQAPSPHNNRRIEWSKKKRTKGIFIQCY